MNRSGNLWWGMILIAVGTLFLLDNMGYADFGEVVRTYWPVVFVFWGVSILLRRSNPPQTSVPAPPAQESSDAFGDRHENPTADQMSYSSVFGDLTVHARASNFKGGSVSSVFGDAMLDLSGVTLGDGENVLRLSGVFGDARLMLASGMPYSISGHSLFGSVQAGDQHKGGISATLVYQTPDYATAARKLHIDASQVFGDITVTR